MDAVKFIKERNRMCQAYYETGDDVCSNCPAKWEQCDTISSLMGKNADTIVAIVEKWSKEHPRKTRQSVFLERYPEANVDKSTGVLVLCPAALKKEYRDDRGACNAYSIESGVCDNCRRAFWMQEVE